MMNISELLITAMQDKQQPVLLLIDFLVKEKKVLELSDPVEKLNVYLDPEYKHRDYVNQALYEYIKKRQDDKNWICYGYYKGSDE